MNFKNIEACIFDFDGVIIDSEMIHARSKQITLDHYNVEYPAHIFEKFKGRTDKDFFTYSFQHLSDGQTSIEIMLEYKKSAYARLFEEIKLIKGVDEFILFARKRFSKLGITTSTTLHDYSLAIKKFKIEKHFDFIITGEDTIKHKPDPEPYLLASNKLNCDIARCIVIEDSPNGIISAKAAGFFVLGITTSFSKEELKNAGANFVSNSYPEMTTLLLS